MNRQSQKTPAIKLRKHLNADSLFQSVYVEFSNIPDHRSGEPFITMPDALMSAFAMFSLKDPSLLAFEQRRIHDDSNLHSIYKIKNIPSDTWLPTFAGKGGHNAQDKRIPYCWNHRSFSFWCALWYSIWTGGMGQQ